MTKQDWIEYFEAFNGREPSDSEIEAAIANGEIVLEETPTAEVSETPDVAVQTEPVQQVQESATQQDKRVQPKVSAVPASVAVPSGQEVKEAAASFGNWFLSALKNPMATIDAPNEMVYSWIVFAVYSLLASSAVFFGFNKLSETLIAGYNNATSGLNTLTSFLGLDISMTNPVGIKEFLAIWGATAVMIFSVILSGFVWQHYYLKDNEATLLGTVNHYNRFYTWNVLLSAAALLLGFLGQPFLAMFALVMTVFILWGVSFNSLVQTKNDQPFAKMVAVMLHSLLILIVIWFVLSASMQYLQAMLSNII